MTLHQTRMRIAAVMGMLASMPALPALSETTFRPQRKSARFEKPFHSGSTYNVGRNKRKREMKTLRKQGRAIQVRMANGKKAPKGRELAFLKYA